ncbi:hypothetical protein [Duganella violaceipulchra]|uniref:Uncharacterized protein n=1 Tax=Duganella violaceipulchra TaxID=2849652 RepID=A0AA41L044_9BURK|nr:hypothetical protein [Duganella violaceicalia]MBV6321956.1 hypothetical protein [Duganella violaceicalia]MCP2007049.1 hypothetical protein [Duganella violaceicalia]
MTHTTHPSKQQTRLWLQQRTLSRLPPPELAEIRSQLGWKLLPNNAVSKL